MIKSLIKQSPKEQLMSLLLVWQAWFLPLLSPGAVEPCALFKRSSLVLVLQLGQETFSPTFSSTKQNVLELVHIRGMHYVRAKPGQPFRDKHYSSSPALCLISQSAVSLACAYLPHRYWSCSKLHPICPGPIAL